MIARHMAMQSAHKCRSLPYVLLPLKDMLSGNPPGWCDITLHVQAAGLAELQSGLRNTQTNQTSAHPGGASQAKDKLPVMDEGADLLELIGAGSTQ